MPRLINIYFLQAFSLVKYNLVLFLPFFIFMFLMGFFTGSNMFIMIPAIIAVFLAGWLNMFKKCIEASVDENLPDEKRTENSFLLFREFFPGVGKYFIKIAIGLLICLLLFNVLMLVLETVLLKLLGGFETFSQQGAIDSLKSMETATAYWSEVSDTDRFKIAKIAGAEILFCVLFAYFTMFWAQITVLLEKFPIKSIMHSLSTVIKDPINTAVIFLSAIASVLGVMFIGAILATNPILQLLILILFVFVIVYFTMVTFIYLEKSNRNSRTDSIG